MLHPLRLLREMASLPREQIPLWGDDAALAVYRSFVRPHPKWKVIRSKQWGVGLLPLPESFADYLGGRDRQAVRTNRNRAMREGFHFSVFSPLKCLDEMLEINRSAPRRQGRPMAESYLRLQALEQFSENVPEVFGVFDVQGRLRAYAHTPVYGDIFLFSRILGHQDALGSGIMYYLASEVIQAMIVRRKACGLPKWAMYDTFFGANSGLRYFKERLGFKPYRVDWVWKGDN